MPEIRSLEKIKAGSEITVNYMTRSLAMKNRKTRQNELSSERGFECCCELCEKESTVSDDEKYERFKKLKHEVDQLLEASNNLNERKHWTRLGHPPSRFRMPKLVKSQEWQNCNR